MATFWGEEESDQRLVVDFPLEFAAWLYRPEPYVASCFILGVAYLVQSILTMWRSPYGNVNVRPQPVPEHRYPAILYSYDERLVSIVNKDCSHLPPCAPRVLFAAEHHNCDAR